MCRGGGKYWNNIEYLIKNKSFHKFKKLIICNSCTFKGIIPDKNFNTAIENLESIKECIDIQKAHAFYNKNISYYTPIKNSTPVIKLQIWKVS